MIPQVRGFQGCYLDNHRNNWRCARAVRKRPLSVQPRAPARQMVIRFERCLFWERAIRGHQPTRLLRPREGGGEGAVKPNSCGAPPASWGSPVSDLRAIPRGASDSVAHRSPAPGAVSAHDGTTAGATPTAGGGRRPSGAVTQWLNDCRSPGVGRSVVPDIEASLF